MAYTTECGVTCRSGLLLVVFSQGALCLVLAEGCLPVGPGLVNLFSERLERLRVVDPPLRSVGIKLSRFLVEAEEPPQF